MDYGFRVSLPGKDVLTCDDKDLVITSKAPCFKIIETKTVSAIFNVFGVLDMTIRHESQLPFFAIAYYYSSAVEGWWQIENLQYDNTNLYAQVYDTDTLVDPVITYFILYG